jgi:hypothetical protein
MKSYLIAGCIGLFFGLVDIIPMILQKLPKRANISAFMQYFFVSLVISFIDLPGIVWWLEGSIVALALAVPIIIVASEKDKKVIFIIGSMAMILGALISLTTHYFL